MPRDLTFEQFDALAQTIQPAFDEWVFRMHGLTSSCGHETEAAGIADALRPVVAQMLADERERIAREIDEVCLAEDHTQGVGICLRCHRAHLIARQEPTR